MIGIGHRNQLHVPRQSLLQLGPNVDELSGTGRPRRAGLGIRESRGNLSGKFQRVLPFPQRGRQPTRWRRLLSSLLP